MLRHDKNNMSADGGQVFFTGLPRVIALARNGTAGAVKQNRAVRKGCGPQATQTQKTTSL